MPVPPPVTTTVFPLAESSGRVGDMDWYVLVCHVEVGDGKGAAMVIVKCMDDWEGWVDCSMRNILFNDECHLLFIVE